MLAINPAESTLVDQMKEFSEIADFDDHKLYLTGYMGARGAPKNMAILSLMSDPPVLVRGEFNKWVRIEDDKNEDIKSIFDGCHEFIDEHIKVRDVVVHCAAGVSRSATIVISYIMKKCGYTYMEAHDYVRARRSIISPNSGFTMQLIDYEFDLMLDRTITSRRTS